MFCGQCGKTIQDDSKFCRFCGAIQTPTVEEQSSPSASQEKAAGPPESEEKAGSQAAWITGAAIAFIFIIALIAIVGSTSPSTSPPAENAVATALDSAGENLEDMAENALAGSPVTPKPSEGSWSYTESEDKVRGGKSYFASTTSTNEVHLDFPYEGGSTLRMTVRKSPAYGADVLLILSSGQLICPSYEGCHGTVRFDTGPAQYVSFSAAADNSSDTIFVNGARNFIAKLKRAKRVVIEVEIYQAGRPQFEFDVRGLQWDH